jgi:hypothetical protein
MPEGHGYSNEEKERKQRIKKLKARTSKMRLAEVTKRKRIKSWDGNTGTVKEDGSVVDDSTLTKSLE